MLKKTGLGAALIICLGALIAARQSNNAPARTPALTALDYIEIQQLVNRYGWALDSGADNGYAYADLYAPDATFTGTNQGPAGRSYQGRDRLAALARGGKRGPSFVSHYVTNLVVEPTAEGAVGRTYVAIFDIGNGGNGAASTIDHGGLYNDVYVKTAGGWRFKSRTYYESKSGEPVQPPPAPITPPAKLSAEPALAPEPARQPAGNQPRLTVEDYLEIQQLVSRYPYALDVDPDNGASYANLFTPDAVFRQPRTEGREALARLAASAPHGPMFVRHFLANQLIDPAPGGATGRQYLVAIDIGENGMPSSIFLGGHYEDVYAKTAEGWRFKTRTFIASATGNPPEQPAARGAAAPAPGR
ncbi:MAG: nuclear transport factor 2 family protein [Acidobacteriota bacterium]